MVCLREKDDAPIGQTLSSRYWRPHACDTESQCQPDGWPHAWEARILAAGHRQSLRWSHRTGTGQTCVLRKCRGALRQLPQAESQTSQGSKISATLNKNGLQTCELPANAQISSKIKLINLLETFPKRYSWKNKRQCRFTAVRVVTSHAAGLRGLHVVQVPGVQGELEEPVSLEVST